MIITERRGSVLVITINRAERRNALDRAASQGLTQAVEQLEQDPTLTVGVLTGAGGTFSAGMDLKAFLAGEKINDPVRGLGFTKLPAAKPMIAAVEGYALAGGFELALACDLIVASESAKFGLPEVKRGLIAAAGGLFRLPQRIPKAKAVEYLLTGDFIEAVDGHALGLVNILSAPGGALQAALDLADRIAANGPLAVRATKTIIDESAEWPMSEAFERQQPFVTEVFNSADAREGSVAFGEKRVPVWQGR
ncbi:enoyl-CoA hydratase [Leucobacter exalbidus]|uniref:Enoyl-CoA hydratase n=1 Tax=Leucobacter exalbidus TaxID=662960 RepID=A0A940PQH5_9MICO|nr:enoyl-CoA hydratase [Leucobacter exalbidus]